MIVERINDEILVRFSSGSQISKIQSILDYLRYEELTAKSTATASDLDKLISEVKKERWEKIKKSVGIDE